MLACRAPANQLAKNKPQLPAFWGLGGRVVLLLSRQVGTLWPHLRPWLGWPECGGWVRNRGWRRGGKALRSLGFLGLPEGAG